MKAIISRLLISPIFFASCLFVLPSAVPHAQAAAAKPHGSAKADKSEDTVPKGLADSDWNSIRQVYEQNRHAAVAVDGEFRARNPGQQWLTHFDGRGFTVKPATAGVEPEAASWRWGLELKSYGFPGHEHTISGQAKMTTKNNRVSYNWHEGLREWFVNDGRGLEHGFTLDSRPPGAGDTHPGAGNPQLGAGDPRLRVGKWLELRLAVRGGLQAQGHADGLGVSFVNEKGNTVIQYTGLKVWDADHRVLPARIEVDDADATGLRLSVDERGARYPLTIDPIAQQAYLKASNTDAGDRFGLSVAVSGDTVVVGADHEGSDNAGAAYVFVRDGFGAWSQQAYLKASNADAGDLFGTSVAVSGDTMVVGAQVEDSAATGVNGNPFDNSANAAGAAYVFVRDGGVWSQQAYLKASNTDAGDVFGYSVAVSGDTVVVGATRDASNAVGVNGNEADNSAGFSGAAYVFVRGGGVWSQQAYLKASNTDAGDVFGWSVAVSGDTVVVGAWQEASNATGINGNQTDNSAGTAGAAYVFVRDGGAWTQQAYLKASNTDGGPNGLGDHFGSAVSVSGDTVVVGANGESSSDTGVNGNEANNQFRNAGAAYVYVRDGFGVWTQQAYLKASNTAAGDVFGASVAVSGDTLVVGAQNESSNATGVDGNQANNSASGSGAAYVFVRDGASVWSQQAYLKASNTDALDLFGFSVAVSGDTVVVGAYWEDSNATDVNGNHADNSAINSGAAYIFLIAASFCGNEVIEGDEECDDGDTIDGDGCSSICMIETGYTCDANEPSFCTDIDECVLGTDSCDVNATCVNSLGGFICICDDGNVCTVDTWDLVTGCDFDGTGITIDCDDNDACTVDDTCQADAAGTCQGIEISIDPVLLDPDSPGTSCCVGGDNYGLACMTCSGGSRNGERCMDSTDCTGGGTCDVNDTLCPGSTCGGLIAELGVNTIAWPKSRYIGVQPNPTSAGIDTAIRVIMIDINGHLTCNGEVRWAGPPFQFCEGGDCSTLFWASPVQTNPHWMDWTSVGLVQLYGEEIVPDSRYSIQMICESFINDESSYSSPALLVDTAKWGDVDVPYAGFTAATQPAISDVLKIVDKWLGNFEPRKSRSQLQPAILDPSASVGIADVLKGVDAWLGTPYPFSITTCP